MMQAVVPPGRGRRGISTRKLNVQTNLPPAKIISQSMPLLIWSKEVELDCGYLPGLSDVISPPFTGPQVQAHSYHIMLISISL